MTRLVRIAALSCVAGAILASAALANVPDPSKSTLGINLAAGNARLYINAGGSIAGVPDQCSDGICNDYTVEVRDFSNNPIAGSSVVIDFVACTPGLGGDSQISCDQLNAATGQSYISPSKVAGSTAANGRFTFKVQGAGTSNGTNSAPGILLASAGCAKAYADGVLLGSLKVVHYDFNGVGSPGAAVNAADAGQVLNENTLGGLSGTRYTRTNIDNNTVVNAADASRMLTMGTQATLGTGSRVTAPYCP